MHVDCAIIRHARRAPSLINGMPAIVVDLLGGSVAALCLVYSVKQHPFACAMPHHHRANAFSRRVPGVHLWRYLAACKVWVPAKWESKINGGKKYEKSSPLLQCLLFAFRMCVSSALKCRLWANGIHARFCMKISCVRSSNFLCPPKSFWLIAGIF